MKIAFVVHDYRHREGHSRYVVELATRFARDHEVHVFANEIEAEENSPIHFHRVSAWRPNALSAILSFAVFATLQVRGKFDIIHNQGLCGLRGNVVTAHICNRAWVRALRETAGRLSVREWVSGNIASILEYAFYRSSRNRHVIAVSHRVEQDIRRCYHSSAPISVIHHGVDLKTFTPAHGHPARSQVRAECGLSDRDVAFLFVGDMRKGATQSIQALARVPGAKMMFVSRSAEAPYRALATKLGVSERVLFLGERRQMERYYAAADAFVLPSHYDSFAMVVTEAMAAALPVIVSREAGVSELIEPGINGLLLDNFNDTEELAQKMQLLVDDRALADRLGAAGRRTVETHSWDLAASKTMSVYQQLLTGRAHGEVPERVSGF
jgi:glycosyltransferase involved in cell wall biosynthesis